METVNNELSGIVGALFRQVGVAVGTSVAVSRKITGLGVGGVAAVTNAVTNLVKRSDGNVEPVTEDKLAKARSKAEKVQHELKKASSEQKELKSPSLPTVATVGTKEEFNSSIKKTVAELDEQAKAVAEPLQSPPIPEPQVEIPSTVTEAEVEAAVFPNEADRIIFLRAVSDISCPDAALRVEAIKTIAGVSHELTVKTLIAQMAADPSAQVRQECINALILLEIEEGLPAVRRALTDPAASVRLAAVWGLYHLAGQESISGLLPMVFDEDEEVRRRAVTCIGWLGKKEYAMDLVPLLTDSSVPVRRAVAEALGNLRPRQIVSALIERLNDPDKSVREAVLGAIETITGKKMNGALPSEKESLKRFIARWREWWKQELLG